MGCAVGSAEIRKVFVRLMAKGYDVGVMVTKVQNKVGKIGYPIHSYAVYEEERLTDSKEHHFHRRH